MLYLELEVNGKTYKFRLTHKAKLEIDEYNISKLEKMGDPEIAKAYALYTTMDKENATKEEQADTLAKFMPHAGTINRVFKDMDCVDLGYILLRNTKENEGLTRAEYEEIYETVEEEKGFEETYEMFKGMQDKVFTVLEKMNTPKTQPAESKILN